MSEEKMMRLGQVARKLNVGIATIVESMAKKGFEVEGNPNSKISQEHFNMLAKEFKSSAQEKEEASHLSIGKRHNENFTIKAESETEPEQEKKPVPEKQPEPKPAQKPAADMSHQDSSKEKIKPDAPKLDGLKVLGKIDLEGKKPAPQPAKEEAPKPSKPVSEDSEKTQQPTPPSPKGKDIEEVSSKPPAKEVDKPEPKEEKAPEKTSDTAPKADPAPKGEEAPKTEAPKEEAKKEDTPPAPTKPEEPKVEEEKKESVTEVEKGEKVISAKADSLKGLTVLGKIELPKDKPKKKSKPVASSDERNKDKKKRPRKRIDSSRPRPAGGDAARTGGAPGRGPAGKRGRQTGQQGARGKQGQGRMQKAEPTQKEIQEQIKQTLARLQGGKSGGGRKNRRDKKQERSKEVAETTDDGKVLKVTEFISANDLASLMDVSVNEVISVCMSLGMFVSINQRLDAEAITIIADEFNYEVEFTKTDEEEAEVVSEEGAELLEERAPIVTIMGHVDHGKTSLLDYIRRSKVTHGEAGGITQHIGAYDVMTEDGHKIAFLDTPGHEAFTAMRARGAKITDVAIIVIAADDNVMPQTKEAINHAQVAGVPMIFAINKVDKPNANPDKIKEELANMNLLVEDWGGKYQSQEISAKTGQGVDDLLEKVLLEAEILELKANPNKNAVGTVVEASLDKGRGYVTTIMVQAGTLKVGDVMLAGQHYGRVKAMFDHLGQKVEAAGPSTPVQVLGLSGAPQAGDIFKVYDSEREAREIANSREQIQREQSLRTKKHITLDEIGRRLAIGSFKELNIIIKGDVDGSVEALADSLLKLSKDEVKVNIIHQGVGQISESDVLLASASDAIILGFQVRPSANAKRLSEQEEIEIRHYSVIYDAINQIKDAIEGMLEPEFEEVITGNIEVREVFKISKIGTVAGCYVTDGLIQRKNKIRVIRDGIVIHDGEIDQLKRFKDDVNEVKNGYECGVSIKNFNDIQVGDTFEGYKMEEIKRKK
jgi:translation initiation factor IF-2